MNIVKISCLFFLISFNSISQEKNTPKVVVGIVVDQMCYEYLYRYNSKFSEGGFKRLMNDGTNCRTTMYNYVPTYTGPGHASIYTGTTPENHGIIENEWYDRKSKAEVNCVQDDRVSTVGSNSKEGQCAPTRLKCLTITDQLKMTYTDSKVISVSIKNRSAILPGGHLSDGSYWYDYSTGDFITSTFYKNTLPTWVSNFNKQDYPQSYLKQTWSTLYDIKTYTESGPDNSPYEHLLPGKTSPTFPYNLKEMSNGKDRFDLFTSTPFANTYLTDFAIGALKNELLGKNDQVDMLCISYSTPDIIGHSFGPQSIEIQDTYLRLDLEIERLLKALDKEVGENEYVVFLTADHAVVPVPQYLVDNKLPGGSVYLKESMKQLNGKLFNQFGDSLIVNYSYLNVYLDHDVILSKKLNKAEICQFVKTEIESWDHVKRVYTGEELLASGGGDVWTEKVKRGYNRSECGDIVFILESGYLPHNRETATSERGTSHGSGFSYDSHVPLLWYGKGIPKQEIFRPISIVDITPTLAHLLYVAFPSGVTGNPILEILGK